MQKGLNIASSKGYKPLVEYYLVNYPKLNLSEALHISVINKRKNVSKILRRKGARSSPYFSSVNLK